MSSNVINYSLLWDKIKEYAMRVGRMGIQQILLMYFVLRSPDTPRAEKILIYSTLSYLVLPVDLISAKRLPVIGWIDELVSLTVAYEKISRYVTPAIEHEVDRILDKWFPIYTEYELIDE